MSDRAPSPTEPSRVFLTGGSGLLGSHIAERLLGEGHEVVALNRPGSDTSFLKEPGRTCSERRRYSEHAGGCGAGRRAPCRACVIGRGVRTDVRSHRRGGATRWTIRPGDFYGRSKRLAEEAAAGMHESGRMQVTIVRPSAVDGEGDRLFAPTLARILRLPVVPVMGHGDNTVPVVYAGNVAAGVASALDGRESGSAFNLALDYPLTQRELLDGLARGLGRSPTFICLPAALVRAVASVADGVSFMVPGLRGLSGARVTRLGLGENPYPSQRAREWLGWRPSVPHESALRRTGRWLLRRHDNEVTES